MKVTVEYAKHGTPARFYAAAGDTYRNPQERELHAMLLAVVPLWGVDVSNALDLACGSGEVTLAVRSALGGQCSGADPYTGGAYQRRTGQACECLSFEDVAALNGAHPPRHYSAIICSFALHLLDASYLFAVLSTLAQWSDTLLILTPHKRPHIKPSMGWRLVHEHYDRRVRARLYRACTFTGSHKLVRA